ncbi:MAG: gamma-glutamyl-gamma-aminobutyrate hydrolase family protein [Rhodobacterales bacterium]
MKKPIVGIIANSYTIDGGYAVQASGIINVNAIAHVADAMPVIIPSMDGANTTEDLVSRFDGFVFTGGRPNVHPNEYGEQATSAHGTFDRNRDAVVLPLIRQCVARGTPILGICRGFQEFNVAYGGTLHPEIRDLPGRMNHRMPPDGTQAEKFAHRHDVSIEAGSIFEQVFGASVVRTNSLHGQGIKTPGARISIDGHAPDGTPEALSVKDAQNFALAVQWHPEWNADKDPVSSRLFTAFGKALRGTF